METPEADSCSGFAASRLRAHRLSAFWLARESLLLLVSTAAQISSRRRRGCPLSVTTDDVGLAERAARFDTLLAPSTITTTAAPCFESTGFDLTCSVLTRLLPSSCAPSSKRSSASAHERGSGPIYTYRLSGLDVILPEADRGRPDTYVMRLIHVDLDGLR